MPRIQFRLLAVEGLKAEMTESLALCLPGDVVIFVSTMIR